MWLNFIPIPLPKLQGRLDLIICLQNRVGNRKNNYFSVQKPGKWYLNQVIKVNIVSDFKWISCKSAYASPSWHWKKKKKEPIFRAVIEAKLWTRRMGDQGEEDELRE